MWKKSGAYSKVSLGGRMVNTGFSSFNFLNFWLKICTLKAWMGAYFPPSPPPLYTSNAVQYDGRMARNNVRGLDWLIDYARGITPNAYHRAGMWHWPPGAYTIFGRRETGAGGGERCNNPLPLGLLAWKFLRWIFQTYKIFISKTNMPMKHFFHSHGEGNQRLT